MFYKLLFEICVAHEMLILVTSIQNIGKKHKKQPDTRTPVRLEDERRFKDQKWEKSSW